MSVLARGRVTDRPWGRTFATPFLRGITGQLTVASEGKQFLVAFERGAVVAATSPLAADAAVRIALTGHLVSSSQVPEISRRQAAAPDRDEISVIAELARLGPDHALRLRRRVIAQRAARTFSVNHGEFVFTDDIELPILEGCELDVRAVIYIGARTNLSEPRLAMELHQLGMWFQLRASLDEDLPQYGFGDLEEPVIERLREGGTLDELEQATKGYVDARTVRAVVYALAVCNACEVVAAEPRGTGSQPSSTTTARMATVEEQELGDLDEPAERAGPASTTQPLHGMPASTAAPPTTSTPASMRGAARRPSSVPPVAAASVARTGTSSTHPSTKPMPTVAPAPAEAVDAAEPSPSGAGSPELATIDESYSGGRRGGESDSAARRSAVGTSGGSESGSPSRESGSGRRGGESDSAVRQLPGARRSGESDSAVRQLPGARRSGESDSAVRQLPGAGRNGESDSGVQQSAGSSPALRPPPSLESSAQVVVRRVAASRPAPVRRVARTESSQSHEVKAVIAQRLKLLDQGADHFALLGVPHDVATDTLRKAYFALARQLHPDRLAALGISDDGKHAQRLFAQINTGFAILSDPARRAQYLHVLRRGGEAAIRAEQARAEEMARRIVDAEEAFRRGELALRRDQPQAAIAELELAVQLNPEEADYRAMLAWSAFCAAPDKPAIAARTRTMLEKAIQRAPKAVTARLCLGRVERMLGRDQDAIRHFRDVLATAPGHGDAAAELRALESRLGGGDKPGGGLFGRTKR